MSWSHNTTGTRDEVLAAVSDWPRLVEAQDRQTGASEDLVQLHKKQAERVVAAAIAAAPVIDKGKEGYVFHVSGNGHGLIAPAGEGTTLLSDQWGLTISSHKAAAPVPAPAG